MGDHSLCNPDRYSVKRPRLDRKIRAGVYQGASTPGNIHENVRKVKEFAEAYDIVCFPELFLHGYDCETSVLRETALSQTQLQDLIGPIAKQYAVCIGIPYAERDMTCGNMIYNSCALFDCCGSLVLNYQKENLGGPWEQSTFLSSKTPSKIAQDVLCGGCRVNIGMIICYDVEFPEPMRCLALAGAEIVLVPTALGIGPQDCVTPHCVLPTRACENQVFVLYSNFIGVVTNLIDAQRISEFCGKSGIFAPSGETLARATTTEGVDAILALDQYAASTERNPYLSTCADRLARGTYAALKCDVAHQQHAQSRSLCVGVYEGSAQPGNVPGNIATIRSFAVSTTVGQQSTCQLLLFPELFVHGYDCDTDTLRDMALTQADITELIGPIAAAHAVCLGVPYAERDPRNPYMLYNACALFDFQGRLVLNYRKVNLWGGWEQSVFTPGDALDVVALRVSADVTVRVGAIICFDVEFPEPMRCLALQGAEMVLVPTALGDGPLAHLTPTCAVPTRACENHVFVLYSNLCGAVMNVVPTQNIAAFCGQSAVFNPSGTASPHSVASHGGGNALRQLVKIAHLQLDAFQAWVERNPYLRDYHNAQCIRGAYAEMSQRMPSCLPQGGAPRGYGASRTNAPRTVLVTGASGRIGHATCRALQHAGHHVVGFDRHARAGIERGPESRFHKGDLTDTTLLERIMQGVDVVIHLAAVPDEADFHTQLLPINIGGTHNVVQAVRKCKSVNRFVLASSGKMYSGCDIRDTPLDVARTRPQPTCWYSCTKLFGEAAARMLVNSDPDRNLKVFVARFGWVPRTKDDIAAMAKLDGQGVDGMNSYLSPHDAGTFLRACVENDICSDSRRTGTYFETFNVQSRVRTPHHERFSVALASSELGWRPAHTFPEGLEDILDDVAYVENPDLFPRVEPK